MYPNKQDWYSYRSFRAKQTQIGEISTIGAFHWGFADINGAEICNIQ